MTVKDFYAINLTATSSIRLSSIWTISEMTGYGYLLCLLNSIALSEMAKAVRFLASVSESRSGHL
jgi:hypothetical protein